jgi:predicted DNA-binding transcriptional regulator AlpA
LSVTDTVSPADLLESIRSQTVISAEQVAVLFGVAPDSIYRRIRRNEWPTPVIRLGVHQLVFPVAPIVRLLEGGA